MKQAFLFHKIKTTPSLISLAKRWGVFPYNLKDQEPSCEMDLDL